MSVPQISSSEEIEFQRSFEEDIEFLRNVDLMDFYLYGAIGILKRRREQRASKNIEKQKQIQMDTISKHG